MNKQVKAHGSRKKILSKGEKFGNLPVHKYKSGRNHPHVVVKKGTPNWISVGLTSSSRSGNHKLPEVTESTGRKSHLVHYVTEADSKKYKAEKENYTVDEKTEKRAKSMVENYLNKKKK